MLRIDSAAVSGINSNWNNVEFTTGPNATGAALQAWVESNASSSSADTAVWVKFPNGLPTGTTTIYMDIMPNAVMSASGPTGEAPQLSPAYAEYDNGANVFNFYDNFKGTALNTSKWNDPVVGTINNSFITCPMGNGSISIDDGLTEEATSALGCASAIHLYTRATYQPQVLETLVTRTDPVPSGGAVVGWNIAYDTAPPTAGGPAVEGYTDAYYFGGAGEVGILSEITAVIDGAGVGDMLTYNWPITTGIMSLEWPGAGNEAAYLNYTEILYANDTSLAHSNSYIDLVFNTANNTTHSATYQWVRTRQYPPSGVMPGYSVGTTGVAAASVAATTATTVTISRTTSTTTNPVAGATGTTPIAISP